jgi:radical SAM protein with 4Fe4S-binding SPASM domain
MISTPDRYTLGDLNQQDFAALWNGPAYQQFRAQLDSDEPPEVCRSCSVYSGTF